MHLHITIIGLYYAAIKIEEIEFGIHFEKLLSPKYALFI